MLASSEKLRIGLAAGIAALLGVRGKRRGSLSTSGAVAAFLVGFLSLSASVRFGLTLITFYVAGVKATRYKAKLKARIEDGHDGPGGRRNAAQVLASSAPAVVVAVVYWAVFRYDAPVQGAFPLRASLHLSYMLFFAACAGDTFSSEFGIVMPEPLSQPVLVTNPLRRVPRGTNGGVTWQGTVASGFGGFVIGLAYFMFGPDWSADQLLLLPLGILGGIVGSLVDSVLGAIFQISVLDTETGKVLKELPSPGTPESRRTRRICGHNILSGESVNLCSAVLTAALAPRLAALFQS